MFNFALHKIRILARAQQQSEKERDRETPRFHHHHHHRGAMDASFLAVLFAFLISALGMENGTFLGVVLVFAYYPLRY